MAKRKDEKKELIESIERIKNAYNEFFQKMNFLKKKLQEATKKILKKIDEEKLNQIRKKI